MLLVSDVHGAFDELAKIASAGEPLFVLGDMVNFIDYRTLEGIFTDVAGRELAATITGLRGEGDHDGARRAWRSFVEGREGEVEARYEALLMEEYERMAVALDGCEAYVTFGNVDRPDLLAAALPPSARFVDGEVVEIEGLRVGVVGGGVPRLGVPGEVDDASMAAKLQRIGKVDVLCTHVAPAIRQLSHDVVGGNPKGSPAVLRYLEDAAPPWHYFGDIHQPQATRWRVGTTVCRNLGYFRATGRAVRHP
jgi:Icc-related predicted phosphoesterase